MVTVADVSSFLETALLFVICLFLLLFLLFIFLSSFTAARHDEPRQLKVVSVTTTSPEGVVTVHDPADLEIVITRQET